MSCIFLYACMGLTSCWFVWVEKIVLHCNSNCIKDFLCKKLIYFLCSTQSYRRIHSGKQTEKKVEFFLEQFLYAGLVNGWVLSWRYIFIGFNFFESTNMFFLC